MRDLMISAEGLGLAAPQVGLSLRMFVIDLQAGAGPLWVINPVVQPLGESLSVMREGCLSVPGAWGDVERPASVRLSYTDWRGCPAILDCIGLLATAIQHENDHLDGILHLDRMKVKDMRKAVSDSWPGTFKAVRLP
jgi:peptide deformylase